MANASDELLTFASARTIDLTRVANRQAATIVQGPMARADREISRILGAIEDPASLSRAQLRAVERKVSAVLATQDKATSAAIASYTAELTGAEVEAAEEALSAATRGTGIDIKQTRQGKALRRVRTTQMLGMLPTAWFTGGFANDRGRVLQEIRKGVTDGLSTQALRNAVVGTPSLRRRDGVRQVSRNAMDTSVQTLTTHASNLSHSEVNDANGRLIQEERWVAVLDGKTSAICRALDGRVWPVGEGPYPPAHPNCRSRRIPILKGLKALPTKEGQFLPSSVADRLDGQGPAALTYGEWLKKRSAAFQTDVLGPTRRKLWLSGKATMDRFVNDRGRLLTISELRRRMPDAFTEAFGVDRKAISARLADRLSGPKATQITSDIDELFAAAAVADPVLRRTVRELATDLNGTAVFPPGLKGRARVIEKANAKYGGDFAGITDFSRGTLTFDNLDDVYRSLDALEDKGIKIVRFNDRFVNPTNEGYSDIILGVEMPNGHVGELQLHINSVLDVKEANHVLYERQRTLLAQGNLTPAELAEVDDLIDQQRASYSAALESAD